MKPHLLLLAISLTACSFNQYTSPTGEKYTGLSVLENTQGEVTKAGSFSQSKIGKDQTTGPNQLATKWMWSQIFGDFFGAAENLGGKALDNGAAADKLNADVRKTEIGADVQKTQILNPPPTQ